MNSAANDLFFSEYTSRDAILKYSKATAGYGISYLLEHDYKDIYLQALALLPEATRKKGIRVLEFGCGAGMNLLHLVNTLEMSGIKVEMGVGSDFSPVLIETAGRESKSYLPAEHQPKIKFCVAKNEALVVDIASAVGKQPNELKGSFHFILGVNTIRYCHRLGKEIDQAQGIYDLLVPGGVCVAIDMNNRFPLFRSALRDRLKKNKLEYYLPTLEEYTAPFQKTGFKVLRSEHFSWIPHSAGHFGCAVLNAATPILNTVVKSHAMRSLVVAQKP